MSKDCVVFHRRSIILNVSSAAINYNMYYHINPRAIGLVEAEFPCRVYYESLLAIKGGLSGCWIWVDSRGRKNLQIIHWGHLAQV